MLFKCGLGRWWLVGSLSSSLVLGSATGVLADAGHHGEGAAFHGGAPVGRPMAAPSARPMAAPAPRMVAPAPRPYVQPRAAPPPTWNRSTGPTYRTYGRAPAYGDRYVNRGRDVYIQRNTVVRAGPRPYAREPYRYGGRSFYAYHPYAYHRYSPFFFGPGFYPFGAFVATLAAGAIIVSVADSQYYYDQGVWYLPTNSG